MPKRMLKSEIENFASRARLGYINFGGGVILSLINHIKALEDDENIYRNKINRMQAAYDDALADIAKHGQRIVELEREKRKLQEKLEAKKVKLPKEVAEALRVRLIAGDDIEYVVWNVIQSPTKNPRANENLLILRNYANNRHTLDLIDAIRYGYTVEEPTAEERMRDKIAAALREAGIETPLPVERLAELAVLAARETLAEERQAETTN